MDEEPGPSRRYAVALWISAGAALVLSVVAALTEEAVRRGSILAMIVAALAMAWAGGLHGSARDKVDRLRPLGGAGYQRSVPRHIRLLNGVVTLFYNAGIMVVVLAVLVVAAGLGPQLSRDMFQASPILVAIYLVLLAAALHWRIAAVGGVVRTWATRLHGVLLPLYVVPLVAIGASTLAGIPAQVGPWAIVETHLVVFLLVAALGVGTQAFLAAELPTLFDLVQSMLGRQGERETDEPATPPFVYALLLALGGTALFWVVATQFQLGQRIGGFGSNTAIYLVIAFPVLLVMFFGFSALLVWRQGRRGVYKKKITTKARNDLLVYGLSAAAGGFAAFLLWKVLAGDIVSIGPVSGRGLAMDLTALTIVVTAGPIGWYLHRQNQRIDDVEDRLPDFLNDLAETRRAGLTLTAALQSVALADYGALSKDVRKMAQQVAWGIPFAEALRQFAERAGTALVKRSAYLVIEASKTGGSVAEILKAAARDAYEIKSLEAERRTTMMTYVLVIYVVFAVFLVVLAVLDTRFIPEVLAAAEAAEQVEEGPSRLGGEFITGRPDAEMIRFIYYNAAMVQAVGNGIVTGVLAESRLTAGLRHVAILAALGWFTFRLLLG